MNITGKYTYNEDFEYGESVGAVTLYQNNETVWGQFTFTEKVEDDYEIEVWERVKGVVVDNKVVLKSFAVIAHQNGKEIEYLPNTFEANIVANNKLVGHTSDTEDVCGVFVLAKI
ncbi:MAG: hypothetical protein KAG96_04525 [Ichthyobacteriaceae bacterium]|nr:hypothetical protein [Ichthyobacteriaceae bacterium]